MLYALYAVSLQCCVYVAVVACVVGFWLVFVASDVDSSGRDRWSRDIKWKFDTVTGYGLLPRIQLTKLSVIATGYSRGKYQQKQMINSRCVSYVDIRLYNIDL